MRLNRLTALAFTLLLAPLLTAAAEKRNITEKDLWDFVWIGDPQISPDGSRVAFVRVTVNDKKEGYNTSIWVVPINGSEPPRQLTKNDHDGQPRWSPDGKFLAFVRSVEKDGKPEPPQLAILPMNGGDSFLITDLPKGASDPRWSPDGKTLLFTSSTNPDDLAKEKKKKDEEARKPGPEHSSSPASTASPSASATASANPSASASTLSARKAESESEHESDVHVITRAIYREDNEGYADPKHPQHLWSIAAASTPENKSEPKQLTKGRFDEGNAFWSNDGKKIYFASLHVDEGYYETQKTELYVVDVNGGEPTKLNTFPMDVGEMSLSPDGRQIAFVASTTQPVNSYTQPDLWVADLTPDAKPRNLTEKFDVDIGQGAFGDNAPPRGGGNNPPLWSADGKRLIEVYGKQGKTVLASFDANTGDVSDITSGNQAVLRFRASADQTRIVYTVSSATTLTDLVAVETGKEPKTIVKPNEKLFSQLNLTQPEEIWYESFDGKKIQAWVQRPPDFDSGKKYPLILNIHGGPHAAYGWIFEHEFQWMAAKGYVVLYPNPRGSTTYGQEFGNIIQYHYPGDDYQDLMKGVDELIKRGYIDDKKLGVTGGSGGGLLTNWIIGHTQRFAAAVAQRDIASWADWWYTADFTLFQPNWFKAPPFEDEADYRNRSPITYVKNVKTPTMFVEGQSDYRAPAWSGGEEMFRALKYRKIPTVLVEFPNESHELSRSGGPWHRIERLQHIVGWFDKWLMGASKPEYDVAPHEDVPAKPQAKPSPQ